MEEATQYANEEAAKLNDRDRKLIEDAKKAKVQTLSKEDVAAWREAMKPVWQKFEGDIGKDLIDAALKANNN
jgi:C4-dicarboxylate-binding protein DctP